jgi:hypothetical protein
MQTLAKGSCKHWPKDHANIGQRIMQTLAKGSCKHWPKDHANIGQRIMQTFTLRNVTAYYPMQLLVSE